ncbi:hypothetical protein UA08_02681 [Talaromyces atroroseus]|uniref:F-box domain-containing protein n=1 Tax=Talaromyces atroroseus TaxID=1441469 RepID=A0A225B1Y4_TALAT|nr:hypothetical protein UA08_02681 [Talaromyces atroroseus]OKL61979.1 hypothetical protein UA08_02681 [Talaromyces atroroseus]
MLLQLPTELIQLILKHCNTQSYLQAVLSCHSLYNIAASCREVILHHLKINPGKGIDYDQLVTHDLFLLLRRRTFEQLLNAAFDADRTIHTFSGRTIDIQASSLGRTPSHQFAALVFKEDNNKVHLCRAEGNGTMHVEKTFFPSELLNVDRVRIVKTVVSPGPDYDLLAVLVRIQDSDTVTQPDTSKVSPAFAELAQQWQLQGSYFLLSFVIGGDSFGSSDYDINICRIYEHDNFKVNSLAVDDFFNFAISWEEITGTGAHEVIVYRTSPDECEDIILYSKYTQTRFVDETGLILRDNQVANHRGFTSLGPVASLKFNNHDQLLYTHKGGSIYGYYHDFHTDPYNAHKIEAVEAHKNYVRVQYHNDRLTLAVDIPFFATHESYQNQYGIQVCRWTYLSYGTVDNPPNGAAMAYLLKSQAVCQAAHCQHTVNLDRGRRLRDWEFVARLCNYPYPTSSLGHIFTVSPQSTRIAILDWDILYVWSLRPEEVIQGVSSDYYPDAWCPEETELISLPPLMIRQEAVCFKVMFIDENTIMVLTDRGLRTWDLGSHARQRRIVSNLDIDQVQGSSH